MAAIVADVSSAATPVAGTSLLCALPPNTVDGNLLLAKLTVRGGTGIVHTPPTGWALEDRADNFTNHSIFWQSRIASSEPANYTWSWDDAVTATVEILRITGFDPADPIAAIVEGINPSGTSHPSAPGLTTTANDTLIIHSFAMNGGTNNNWTPDGATSELYENRSTAASSNIMSMSASEVQAVAGPATQRTFTSLQTAGTLAVSLAINPAPPSGSITPGTLSARQWTDSVLELHHEFTGGDGSESAIVQLSPDGSVWTDTTDVYRPIHNRATTPHTYRVWATNLYDGSTAAKTTGRVVHARIKWPGSVFSAPVVVTLDPRIPMGAAAQRSSIRYAKTNFWYGEPHSTQDGYPDAQSTDLDSDIATADFQVSTRDGLDQPYNRRVRQLHGAGRNHRILQYILLNELFKDSTTARNLVGRRNTWVPENWTGNSDGSNPLTASTAAILTYIDQQEGWFMHTAGGGVTRSARLQNNDDAMSGVSGKFVLDPAGFTAAAGFWRDYQCLLALRHIQERHTFGPGGFATAQHSAADLERFSGIFFDNTDPEPRPDGAASEEYGANNTANNAVYRAATNLQLDTIRDTLGVYVMGNVLFGRSSSTTSNDALQTKDVAAHLDGIMLERWGKGWSNTGEVWNTPAETLTDALVAGEILALPNAPEVLLITQTFDPNRFVTFTSGHTDSQGNVYPPLSKKAWQYGYLLYLLVQRVDRLRTTWRGKSGGNNGSRRFRQMTTADFGTSSWDTDLGTPGAAFSFLSGQTAVGGGAVSAPNGIYKRDYTLPGGLGTATVYLNFATSARVSGVGAVGTLAGTSEPGLSGAVVLAGTNPAPTITDTTPDTTVAGGGFTLTINGTGFIPGSVITFGGKNYTPATQSSTVLTATIPAADAAAAGFYTTRVTNPGPGGGVADSPDQVEITGTNPVPTLTILSPSAVQEDTNLTLTLTGTGFVPGAVVHFGSLQVAPATLSATSITIPVTPGMIPNAGVIQVLVENPEPITGGGSATSNSVALTINPNNPIPAITGVSPNSVIANTAATIIVTGTGFVNGSEVRYNGAAIPTTYDTSTGTARLIGSVSPTLTATPGVQAISVSTPAPGGGVSNTLGFTVTVATFEPNLATLIPSEIFEDGTEDVTVRLLYPIPIFNSSHRITFNGVVQDTELVSSTELRTVLTPAEQANPGRFEVDVITV